MNVIKFLLLSVVMLCFAAFSQAQTADEIISNYFNAIGGKDKIDEINSLYLESAVDVMGGIGTLKTTILNGKGYKQEINVMDTRVTVCYTESMGWQINPMTGNNAAMVMPDGQYSTGKDQIFVAGPLSDYEAKGFKAEYQGQDSLGGIHAHTIQLTSPDSLDSYYYFDPDNGYLICVCMQTEVMGQKMDVARYFSEYQMTDFGYAIPYKVHTNYGPDQIILNETVTNAKFNSEIDPAIFDKP